MSHLGEGGSSGSLTELTSLESLARDLGAESARDIVRTFLETLPERLHEITEAQQAGDRERVRRPAHTLKSGAQLVGAFALADAADAVEHGDLDRDLTQVASESAADLRAWIRTQLTT